MPLARNARNGQCVVKEYSDLQESNLGCFAFATENLPRLQVARRDGGDTEQ